MEETAENRRRNKRRLILEQSPLFQSATLQEREMLIQHSVVGKFKKGDVVCRKDSPAASFFSIFSGSVSEIAMDMNAFSTTAVMKGPRDFFGELGVLLEEAYTTTAVVAAPATILVVPGGVFRRFIREHHDAMQVILRLYRRALQNAAQKFISCTRFNVEGRLAYILLMMHTYENRDGTVPITQEELAQHCGIARQTVSSILNGWKKGGLILMKRGGIAVKDPDSLTDILIENAKEH